MGPVALESSLGWILAGCNGLTCGETTVYGNDTYNNSITLHTESVEDKLERFWRIESVSEIDDECVIHGFEKSIKQNESLRRYIIELPFKPDHEILPDNFEVCKNRMFSLLRGFSKRGIKYKDYYEIFKDYEKQNIIEKVPINEMAKEPGTIICKKYF